MLTSPVNIISNLYNIQLQKDSGLFHGKKGQPNKGLHLYPEK